MKDKPAFSCESQATIGDTWIIYCTIPAVDRGKACKDCPYNRDAIEALATIVVELDARIKWLGA